MNKYYIISEAYNRQKSDVEYKNAVSEGRIDDAFSMLSEEFRINTIGNMVVNKQGNPKVVYHASKSKTPFNVFDMRYIGAGNVGFHFAESESVSDMRIYHKNGVRARKYFLNIKNPITIDDVFGESDELFNEMDVAYYIYDALENKSNPYAERVIEIAREIDRMNGDYEYSDFKYNDSELHECILKAMEINGVDGIFYYNTFEGDYEPCWVVTNPSSIKLAEPTFDSSNNLISLSRRFDFSNGDIRY